VLILIIKVEEEMTDQLWHQDLDEPAKDQKNRNYEYSYQHYNLIINEV